MARTKIISLVVGLASCAGAWAVSVNAQQSDLLADPAVRVLVEEALIADLMVRSCEGLVPSETGLTEIREIADALAQRAGHTPESAAARLAEADARGLIEQGARRRLAAMGAGPEDVVTVCAIARWLAGGEGIIGALFEPVSSPTE